MDILIQMANHGKEELLSMQMEHEATGKSKWTTEKPMGKLVMQP